LGVVAVWPAKEVAATLSQDHSALGSWACTTLVRGLCCAMRIGTIYSASCLYFRPSTFPIKPASFGRQMKRGPRGGARALGMAEPVLQNDRSTWWQSSILFGFLEPEWSQKSPENDP